MAQSVSHHHTCTFLNISHHSSVLIPVSALLPLRRATEKKGYVYVMHFKINILLIVLYIFVIVLVGRTYVNIKENLSLVIISLILNCPVNLIKTGYCKQMKLNLASIKINFVESNLKILKFMWPETEKI